MLVLTRKIGETVVIDDGIVITILKIQGKVISLGIQAPKEKRISRGELLRSDKESEGEILELSLQ